MYIYLMGGSEEQEAGVFSIVPSDRIRGNGHMKVSLNIRKCFFHCEDGQTLAQVAWRGCGVSILGDIQNVAGRSPGKLALGVPA